MNEKYTYQIGDKIFIQKALSLGQWKQLIPLIYDLKMSADSGLEDIIAQMGDNLYRAMAVVLTEEGQRPSEKNLEAAGKFLEDEIDMLTTLEVVENFFDSNPIPSILEKFGRLMRKLRQMILAAEPNGSTKPPVSSPEETLQNNKISSGITASVNAGPISATGKET